MAVTLSLKTLQTPEGVGRDHRDVTRPPFSIGRGPESDWVLPDPDKILSKRHCNITAKGETWLITDISSNGTFLNGNALDTDLPHPLRDHDRLSLGQYEFEVRVAETFDGDDDASEAPTRFGNWSETEHQRRLTSDPFPAEDKSAEAAHPPIGLPQNFDTLSDGDAVAEHPFAARDDTPDMNAHFQPPRPSLELLPDDWDDEAKSAPGHEKSRPIPPVKALPEDDLDEPLAPPTEAAEHVSRPAAPRETVEPSLPPPQSPPPAMRPAPARDSAGVSADADGFAAFASGAGYSGPAPVDTREALRGVGAAFRAMVAGLRRSIIARASVKTEFRIDQTMIRAAGNNPIKFAADDDDALAALIGVNRQSRVSAREAVAEAMRDIAMHELAVAAAMQSAVRDLLSELAPDKVMRGVRRTKLDELLGSRKQSGWDAYVDRHAEVTRALADDFDSVFGKSFARAYETALKEAAAANDDGGRP